MLEDVRLLVTELITNALRHGELSPGDRVSVKASVDEGAVRIEVSDPGRDGEVAAREPGPRGGGYGLFLVDQLAQRWGVDHSHGTTVWCELVPGDWLARLPARGPGALTIRWERSRKPLDALGGTTSPPGRTIGNTPRAIGAAALEKPP